MTTTKRTRGRLPKYPQLVELAKFAQSSINFDNLQEPDPDCTIKGCSQFPNASSHNVWSVRFFIGGRGWHLGFFPLEVAARIYDACVLRFADYKKSCGVHPDFPNERFNFTYDQAKSDIETNEPLQQWLSDLESFWKSLGILTTRAEVKSAAAEAKKARDYKRTIGGHMDSLRAELRGHFDDVHGELAKLNKKLDELAARQINNLGPIPYVPQLPAVPNGPPSYRPFEITCGGINKPSGA